MNELSITTATNSTSTSTIENWLDDSQIAITSRTTRRKQIETFFEWCTTNSIERVEREQVRQYVQWLQRTEKVKYIDQDGIERESDERVLSESTAAGYYSALRSFSKYLFYEGIATKDVCNGIKAPKQDNSDHFYKRALIGEQVPEFIDFCKASLNKRDFAIVYLMLKNGLRCIEVSRLRVCDIARTEYGIRVVDIWGKGCAGASQVQRIEPETFQAIADYLQSTGRAVSANDKSPLFQSRKKGASLDPKSISRIIRNVLDAAGYDSSDFTAHSLRHTFCTDVFIQSGGDIAITQDAARHKNGNVTRRYIWEAKHQENILKPLKMSY